jgi:hypothetical protein
LISNYFCFPHCRLVKNLHSQPFGSSHFLLLSTGPINLSY